MRTVLAGPKGTAHVGDVIDVPESVATRLAAGGYGEMLDPPSEKPKPAPKLKSKSTAMVQGGSERAGGDS
jgi:hypothetical protein